MRFQKGMFHMFQASSALDGKDFGICPTVSSLFSVKDVQKKLPGDDINNKEDRNNYGGVKKRIRQPDAGCTLKTVSSYMRGLQLKHDQ